MPRTPRAGAQAGTNVSDRLRAVADLSPLDRAIVEILQADGRRSFAQIARDVGVTEKTARRRVLELSESGVVQIAAVTDPRLLGYGAASLFGIGVDGSRSPTEIARDLAQIPTADYVVVAAGRYAIYAEVFAVDKRGLEEVVDEQIRTLPGVGSIEPFPYLSLFYQQPWFTRARSKRGDAGVRPAELTEIDRRILLQLGSDGRAPFQQIAAELHVSEAHVRQRVKRMMESGAARVIAIINPMALEYRTMAWVAMRAQPGVRLTDLAEAVAGLPFVTYVAICAGRFDLFVEVVCVSEDELLRLLDEDVRTLPGLADLEVSLYVELHYKRLPPLLAAAG